MDANAQEETTSKVGEVGERQIAAAAAWLELRGYGAIYLRWRGFKEPTEWLMLVARLRRQEEWIGEDMGFGPE